ncbi:hypothetical protein V1511DRAFT_491459 [Dipodascopsis uninucleata]
MLDFLVPSTSVITEDNSKTKRQKIQESSSRSSTIFEQSTSSNNDGSTSSISARPKRMLIEISLQDSDSMHLQNNLQTHDLNKEIVSNQANPVYKVREGYTRAESHKAGSTADREHSNSNDLDGECDCTGSNSTVYQSANSIVNETSTTPTLATTFSFVNQTTDLEESSLALEEFSSIVLRNQEGSQENQSSQWNNKWNGRVNFKKFKKIWPLNSQQMCVTGSHRSLSPHSSIPLVEYRQEDFGLGEGYWRSKNHSRSQDKRQISENQPNNINAKLLCGNDNSRFANKEKLNERAESDESDESDERDKNGRSPTLDMQIEQVQLNRSRKKSKFSQDALAAKNNIQRSNESATPIVATKISIDYGLDGNSDSDDDLKFRFST